MTKTKIYTFDNLSLHEVRVPVDCRRLTLREQASDVSPVAYNVVAPAITDDVYTKYPGESVIFEPPSGLMFRANDLVGYIQPASGTISFSGICE